MKKSEYLKKMGQKYEAFIAKQLENLGYDVILNGLIMGRKDKGVDLIASKDNEKLLIQCKNWKSRRFIATSLESITRKLDRFIAKQAINKGSRSTQQPPSGQPMGNNLPTNVQPYRKILFVSNDTFSSSIRAMFDNPEQTELGLQLINNGDIEVYLLALKS